MKKVLTLSGIDPTRDRPNRFLVVCLNHLATVSVTIYQNTINIYYHITQFTHIYITHHTEQTNTILILNPTHTQLLIGSITFIKHTLSPCFVLFIGWTDIEYT